MKKIFITIAVLYACISNAFAADDITTDENFKFGKPTATELSMTSYEGDADADAVILYDNVLIHYIFTSNGDFKQVRECISRIKILKEDGLRFADVSFMLYNSNTLKSAYSGITAYSFNTDANGKTVKTELKKSSIFKEKVDDNYSLIKFTIPEVKVGSLIEYRYKVTTDDIYNIPSLSFQASVPTLYSSAQLYIPEFFRFRKDTWGYYHIDVQQGTDTDQIALGGGSYYTYNIETVKMKAVGIPAMKNEQFIWDSDSYRAHVDFELQSINFPNSQPHYYSHTWGDLFESLAKLWDYESNLKISNPLHDKLAPLLSKAETDEDKMRVALKVVQENIEWNGKFSIFSRNPKSALKEGTGNSADINFLLIAALHDAGLKAIPLLFNPRNRQRLYMYPSLDNINCFIVDVQLDSGKHAFLDATNKYSDINIFNPLLMVDKAFPYGDNSGKNPVNLTSLTNNTIRSTAMVSLNPDEENTFDIKRSTVHTNLAAYLKNNEIEQYGSEEKYIENEKETSVTMPVEEMKVERSSTNVKITSKMSLTFEDDGDMIYLNPLILPYSSIWSPNAQKRVYPVEFQKTGTEEIKTIFAVPEGWEIVDMPKPLRISACNNGINAMYTAALNNNMLQISFSYKLNRVMFTPEEYNDLVIFFKSINDTLNSKIVVRKTN